MTSYKPYICIFLSLVLLLSGTALAQGDRSYTVACVGDSLTFGTGCRNPWQESWPALLDKAEGAIDLSVSNYGVYGQTVTNGLINSYSKTPACWASHSAGADVYLVMLGSNDLLLPFWRNTLPSAYRSLLKSYMELPQEPEVIVLLPPDLYFENFLRFTNDQIEELRQTELAIAEELGLFVIDLSLSQGNQAHYCLDGGHFSAEGYALFAEYIYEELCRLL